MIDRLTAALEGRYRIERELGEGGMATVYLAHDLKHDRRVALKVLRPELAAVVGAERFLSEIRTTANLQHPHILPLFDSGEADSFLFYVMPYVEGESLRERLERERQLPVDESVRIARAVAAALQYAHEQGVVHRDIKPANILLSRGEPLVADFGIALALSEAGGGRITETGLSLGTPHYMSPEQASGERSLDPRSDVYALGCVLFEMLTGEPPHAGPTAQSVLARILTADVPRVSELRRSVPPNVDAAVAAALERIPADRMASAAEFARALDDPGFRHGAEALATREGPAAARTARPWKIATLALSLLVVMLSAGLALRARRPAPSVFKAVVSFPEDQKPLTPQLGSSVTLTPDGSSLIYSGPTPKGSWQMWERPAGSLTAKPLTGTEGGWTPMVSPDGGRVAVVGQTGDLIVVDLRRGSSEVLVDSAVAVLDWTPADEIYYYHGLSLGDVWRIPARGGAAEPVPGISGKPGPTPIWGPGQVLPGGEGMVITQFPPGSPGANSATIVTVDFASGSVRKIVQGTDPRIFRGRYLLWGAADGSLMAAPFDPKKAELTGAAVTVAQGVLLSGNGVMHYAVSRSGSLVYRTGAVAGGTGSLVWVSRDGTTTPASDLQVGLSLGLWDAVALSPDGKRVALALSQGPTSHIWVQELGTSAPPSRITFSGTFNVRPHWSPDGRSLTFVTNRVGQAAPTQLWIKPAGGAGAAKPLVQADREVEEGFLSPDGKWVVYRLGGTSTNRDIYAMRPGIDSVGRPLVATSANERSPALSPDGKWLAYVSDETGKDEVFVTPFPDVTAGKWQVSSGGGLSPVFAHDGHELFFGNGAGEMTVADYSTSGQSFTVSKIQPLFSANDLLVGNNTSTYAVSPDDRRFLMISFGGGESQLVWVRDWAEELRQLTAPEKSQR